MKYFLNYKQNIFIQTFWYRIFSFWWW